MRRLQANHGHSCAAKFVLQKSFLSTCQALVLFSLVALTFVLCARLLVPTPVLSSLDCLAHDAPILQVSLEALRRSNPQLADKAEDFAKSGYLLLERDCVSFTSGLHLEFFRYNLARRFWGTPKDMPESLQEFLEEALAKMQAPTLQNSLNLSTRGGVVGGVLESHFQFELYS
jgi:hypothetical protein